MPSGCINKQYGRLKRIFDSSPDSPFFKKRKKNGLWGACCEELSVENSSFCISSWKQLIGLIEALSDNQLSAISYLQWATHEYG
jgi:hypothetical protein